MYYNFLEEQKNTTVTSVRISTDLKKMADEYSEINPDFNLSKFINDRLNEYFFAPSFIKARIAYLKRMLQKEQLFLQKSQNPRVKTQTFSKKELKDFELSLETREKVFFRNCLKVLERDPNFLTGQFKLYRNQINQSCIKREFVNRLNMFQELTQ